MPDFHHEQGLHLSGCSQHPNTFVDITPTGWVFSVEKAAAKWSKFVKFVLLIKGCIIVRRRQGSIFVSGSFILLRVISTQARDIPSERWKPTPEKDTTSTGNELVYHAKIICIDTLQELHKIIQEQQVVMFAERIKKTFVPFVRGDENCSIGRKLVLGVLVNFLRRDSSCLELEIATPDMKTTQNKG